MLDAIEQVIDAAFLWEPLDDSVKIQKYAQARADLAAVRDLVEAAKDVVQWDVEYGSINNLGTGKPYSFTWIAKCLAKLEAK